MAHSFFPACRADEVPPGGKLRVVVEGYPVCVYNVAGTFYAAGDLCPHEQVSLGDGGVLEGEVITCGAHRWCFNVRTGECYEDDDPGFELRRFPVGRRDGRIYVGFPSEEDVDDSG